MKSYLQVAIQSVCLLSASAILARADDLNRQMMQATFKLGHGNSMATCFLLSRPAPDDPEQSQFILVTAGHVLENTVDDKATLFLRKKETEGVYRKVPMTITIREQGKPLWTRHASADVAAMYVVLPNPIDVPALPVDLLATDESLKKYDIHPGDVLACLGFPHRFEANEAAFPVLRRGPIASFPLTPTGVTKSFLLSYNTFSGDSGGPVYMAESNRRVGKDGETAEVRLIMGLVAGQHNIDEDLKTIFETRKIRHRLGLAVVVHAVFIKETIDRLPGKP